MAILETHRLTKDFGKHTAVDRLDLSVEAGTVFGLIGPNGAGKTTTLRMLAGLIEPTSGTISYNGHRSRNAARDVTVRRRVGYMPDFFGVYQDMRSWEYLDFFARCYGIPRDRRARVVAELLELVDLTEKRDSDVHVLSRGMKQRLCLAHALVHDPDVLLLDEPASGLDPRARIEMRELLCELRAMGKTVVVSSHILAELEEMCDAVGIMERGRLVASGRVEDIQRSLQPNQVVRVKVASDVAVARGVLAALPGVHLPDDAGGEDAADEPGWITFELEGGEDARAEVLARLVAGGVKVVTFNVREHDLEQLFMQLTRGEVA
jgi:ABC-2 type transport system ATP-binding protein